MENPKVVVIGSKPAPNLPATSCGAPALVEPPTQADHARSIREMLVKRFPAEVIGDKVDQLLNARKVVVTKQGGVEDLGPDTSAVAEGLRFALHYSVGKPVQTQEVVNRQVLSLERLQARGPLSPAVAEAAAKMLRKLQDSKVIEV